MLSIVGALPLAVIAVCGTPSAEIARPAGAAPGVYRSRPPSEGGERFAALAGPADLGSNPASPSRRPARRWQRALLAPATAPPVAV